jgi:hypothetical protein
VARDEPFGSEPFDELRVSSRVEKLEAGPLRLLSGSLAMTNDK